MRVFFLFVFALILILAHPASLTAQSPAPATPPIIGSVFELELLRDLPTANNPMAVFETMQAQTIGDGFTAGGLNPARGIPFGGYLNSWNQTQFRVGDVTITDPRTGGIPLLLPPLPLWSRVSTSIAGIGVDEAAPALSMTLEPRRPTGRWQREVEGSFSDAAFVTDFSGSIPAVDSVNHLGEAAALVSGPLTDRLGVVAAASWRGLSHVAASNPDPTSDHALSGFGHIVFTPDAQHEWRTLGWVQRLGTATTSDTGVHLQATWERRDPDREGLRIFGAYTGRHRSVETPPLLIVNSMETDPISDLMDPGIGSAQRLSLGARMVPKAARWPLPSLGVDLDRASLKTDPGGINEIREFVDTTPSRAWTVMPGAGDDQRHATTIAAYANERLVFGPVTFDAGLRLEAISAKADGAAQGIGWTDVFPRASVRWNITDVAGLSAVASYRRSGYQMPLNILAAGNPAAPTADVALWDGTSAGPLIARIGPGTGGDESFTRIDPDLQRPITGEWLIAFESRPFEGASIYAARFRKEQTPLLQFTETEIALSEYGSLEVPDVLFHPVLSPYGGPIVPVLNRPSDAYGRDRYLLTNRAGDPARGYGVEFGATIRRPRYDFLLSGVYISRISGPAAAVGYRPTQNDQEVLGGFFVDPNALRHNRGQLFPDRTRAAKAATVIRLPWRARVGLVARYQDGQPFARVVIVPGLNQGATAVRAFHNGGSAFTFTGTLDARVQKVFAAGRSQITAIVDIYNLAGLDEEVSEYIVTAPGFRTPTARQPERTVVIGARVAF